MHEFPASDKTVLGFRWMWDIRKDLKVKSLGWVGSSMQQRVREGARRRTRCGEVRISSDGGASDRLRKSRNKLRA